jgi:hypothetical protein
VVGPGGPAGVDGRQPPPALAVEAVQQPLQLQELLGQGGLGQPVQHRGGQLVHSCHQRRHAVGMSGPRARRPTSRICVRVHDRNLSTPPGKTTIHPKMCTTISARNSGPVPEPRGQADRRSR